MTLDYLMWTGMRGYYILCEREWGVITFCGVLCECECECEGRLNTFCGNK